MAKDNKGLIWEYIPCVGNGPSVYYNYKWDKQIKARSYPPSQKDIDDMKKCEE